MPTIPTIRDPRPDLTADSEAWTILLRTVFHRNRDLYGVLDAMRCEGTLLKANPRWGYTLEPLINRDHWPSKSVYDDFKKTWVVPYQGTLIALLKELGTVLSPSA